MAFKTLLQPRLDKEQDKQVRGDTVTQQRDMHVHLYCLGQNCSTAVPHWATVAAVCMHTSWAMGRCLCVHQCCVSWLLDSDACIMCDMAFQLLSYASFTPGW